MAEETVSIDWLSVFVCVCVCVRERERERELMSCSCWLCSVSGKAKHSKQGWGILAFPTNAMDSNRHQYAKQHPLPISIIHSFLLEFNINYNRVMTSHPQTNTKGESSSSIIFFFNHVANRTIKSQDWLSTLIVIHKRPKHLWVLHGDLPALARKKLSSALTLFKIHQRWVTAHFMSVHFGLSLCYIETQLICWTSCMKLGEKRWKKGWER